MSIRALTLPAATAMTVLSVFTLPALAAENTPAVDITTARLDGSERIDYAGKLRMLSQRITASACNKAAGIGGWEATGYLSASIGEFDRIMTALEHGDVFIGIKNPEIDRRILARLNDMNQTWAPINESLVSLVDQPDQTEVVRHAAEAAPQVLEIAGGLVGDIMGEYADPAVLHTGNALLLDIVGRQRMMPQLISKDACMLAEGFGGQTMREDLAEAMDLYELSLGALADGMPEAGIAPPPNEKIAGELAAVTARYDAVRPVLQTLVQGGTADASEREMIFREMNALTAAMNDVTASYAKASKQATLN